MAGDLKLKAITPVLIGTGSGTQTNNTRVDAGAFDNTSSLAPVVDLVLKTGFSVAPTPGSGIVIALYMVPKVDGANAGAVDTSTPRFPGSSFVGNFEVILSQTGVQYLVIQGVTLSALSYECYLDNQSGQTMATAWTLTAAPTDSQYT